MRNRNNNNNEESNFFDLVFVQCSVVVSLFIVLTFINIINKEFYNDLKKGLSSGVNNDFTLDKIYRKFADKDKGEDRNLLEENNNKKEDAKELPDNIHKEKINLDIEIGPPISKGTVSSIFGFRNINGEENFHTGVDIAAERGTDILGSSEGTIVDIGVSKSLGNYIEIESVGGAKFLYAHCDETFGEKGNIVKKGEVIGKVGSTGDSTGNHLHFSIIKDEKYIDPFHYIEKDLYD